MMGYINRMRLFLILLIFAMAPVHIAYAQDVFSNENQEEEQSIDEQLGITKPDKGRGKTGDVRKDIALRYYDDCKKYKEGVLAKAEQDLFCACISNGIEMGLSAEEATLLYEQNRKGQKARDKMMLKIYAPCMKFPIQDTVKKECMSSKAMDSYPQKRTLCDCQANMITQHVGIHAESIVQAALQSEKWYKDPIGSYLKTNDFGRQSAGYLERCVQIFVYGWK